MQWQLVTHDHQSLQTDIHPVCVPAEPVEPMLPVVPVLPRVPVVPMAPVAPVCMAHFALVLGVHILLRDMSHSCKKNLAMSMKKHNT